MQAAATLSIEERGWGPDPQYSLTEQVIIQPDGCKTMGIMVHQGGDGCHASPARQQGFPERGS